MTGVLELLRAIEARPADSDKLVDHFLDRFGSPVVHDGTATFFLRGNYDSVALVHWVFGLESRIPFSRLPGTDIWYSIDHGASFAAADALVVQVADGGQRSAMPDDYTHIRWILKNTLEAGARGFARYRAIVR